MAGRGRSGKTLATSRFCDPNPKSCGAFFEAQKDALAVIHNDKHKAAEIYLKISKVRDTLENLEKLLQVPDTDYDITPRGIMKVAAFMHRIGTIKHLPSSWREHSSPTRKIWLEIEPLERRPYAVTLTREVTSAVREVLPTREADDGAGGAARADQERSPAFDCPARSRRRDAAVQDRRASGHRDLRVDFEVYRGDRFICSDRRAAASRRCSRRSAVT